MIAIETKYTPPTNTRPAKILAVTTTGRRMEVSIDHGLDGPERHAAAAVALCERMNWKGELIAGATRAGYVFVFANGPRFNVGG
jgi:hypothetical protein